MTSSPVAGSAADHRPSSKVKPPNDPASSARKSAKGQSASRQRVSLKSKHNQSETEVADRLGHPDPPDLKSVVRHYAERETEALALKTLALAKRGHKSALDFVYASLNNEKLESQTPFRLELGSITRLDEIADAQRAVITAATEGQIKPTDAIHYMKMLNELGEAIKNSELQAEVDELRSYVHGA